MKAPSSSSPAPTATATSPSRWSRSPAASRRWSGTATASCPRAPISSASGRLFLRRLSALGRDGGALADHGRGPDAAARGVPVIGICNGFQVLTEAGLLPGALMRNAGLSFVCRRCR